MGSTFLGRVFSRENLRLLAWAFAAAGLTALFVDAMPVLIIAGVALMLLSALPLRQEFTIGRFVSDPFANIGGLLLLVGIVGTIAHH